MNSNLTDFKPFALRKAKIVYNFGLSECNRSKAGQDLLCLQLMLDEACFFILYFFFLNSLSSNLLSPYILQTIQNKLMNNYPTETQKFHARCSLTCHYSLTNQGPVAPN